MGLRRNITGPNTGGLMIPPIKLNAGFAHMAANPGGIALLSQSGAIVTSLIDWAPENQVDFLQIMSLGAMADVDVRATPFLLIVVHKPGGYTKFPAASTAFNFRTTLPWLVFKLSPQYASLCHGLSVEVDYCEENLNLNELLADNRRNRT